MDALVGGMTSDIKMRLSEKDVVLERTGKKVVPEKKFLTEKGI